ncbi:MAG: hypothetical protein WC527_08765 [Candidatus Margulisiibacteriota bacterium]
MEVAYSCVRALKFDDCAEKAKKIVIKTSELDAETAVRAAAKGFVNPSTLERATKLLLKLYDLHSEVGPLITRLMAKHVPE